MNNINEICKKLNNIDDLKSEESVKQILKDVAIEILAYTQAYRISICLYDEYRKILNPYICVGYTNNSIEELNEIHIDDDVLEKIIYGKLLSGEFIKLEDLQKYGHSTKYINNMPKDIKYLGCYKIVVDEQFIGVLNISYKEELLWEKTSNECIKFICKMMAVIIRSSKLNEIIKIESKKRIMVENELDDYLDTSADLFSVFDIKGNLIKVSSSWKKILGWEISELVNHQEITHIHPDDLNAVYDLRDYLISDGEVKNSNTEITARCLCKNGGYKWIRWQIKYSYRTELFISIGKDISQEVLDEEKKKNMEEVIKLETMKNEFFSSVSHEFKTPLNIILGTMQIMDKKIVDNKEISLENLLRYVNSIKQNSYRLLRLVNNLIDISRLDIGCYNISLSNNNIINIIEEITSSVAEYMNNNNISLIFDTDSEEIITSCDPSAIERVMLNLLSNAIKYTSSKEGKIEVTIKNKEDKIVVSVKDNGVGIPEDKLDIIFDRFGQANTELTRANEGSGIGLSLVQSIIELHGGNISVESQLHKGSNFIFEMPITLIETDESNTMTTNDKNYHIEKCNVEFADIYSL